MNRLPAHRCFIRLLLLSVSAATVIPVASSQGAFAPSQEIDLGAPVSTVIYGDWNGDGAPDIATAGDHIAISLNDGTGLLLAPLLYPGVAELVDLHANDINRDGNDDIVALNSDTDSVHVYLGNGDGTFPFLTPIVLPLPVGLVNSRCDMAIGDVDGDGWPDLAVAVGPYSQLMHLAINIGEAPFFEFFGPVAGAQRSRVVEFADVDDDGDLDLAWASENPDVLRLKFNDGTGVFAGPVYDIADLSDPRGLAVADFDGNGRLDFAISGGYILRSESLRVVLNYGGGVFGTRVFDGSTDGGSGAVDVGDLDGDGDMDIAVTDSDETAVIFYNDGAGCFANGGCPTGNVLFGGEFFDPSVDTSVNYTFDVAVVDLDSDDRVDMVWGAQYGLSSQTKLYVHLNVTPRVGTYPGTGEDLEQRSSVAATGQPIVYSGGGLFDVKTAAPGEVLRLHVQSRTGAFDFSPILLLANLGPTVPGLPAPVLPGIALDLNSVLVLASGLASPFPSALVLPEGWDWSTPIPPGLAGNSLFVQAIAFPGAAPFPFQPATSANGIFVTTDAHEIRF